MSINTQPTAGSTVAEVLVCELAQHTKQIFGVTRGGNTHLMNAFLAQGSPVTSLHHEAAAIASADAYTRITGELAIASTGCGAGYTNMLTALAEASQARTPMIVLVGDQPEAGPRPWDVDQEMMAAAMSVRTRQISRKDPAKNVAKAVQHTLTHRRPVVLAVPEGVGALQAILPSATQTIAVRELPSAGEHHRIDEHTPDDSQIDTAAKLLADAERPIVLAGRGAHLAGAGEVLSDIAERVGALTATTALARGLFQKQRYDLGVTGSFGHPAAMQKFAEADVVLAVGASLNQFTTRFGDLFAQGSHLIRIDLEDRVPPHTNVSVSHTLLRGDAYRVSRRLLERLRKVKRLKGRYRKSVQGLEPEGALRVRDRENPRPDHGFCADGLLDPRCVAVRIGELLPEATHITSDNGPFIGWANMYWPVRAPSDITMVGTAYRAVGLGIASLAGVVAAAQGHTVALTAGHESALMGIADLESTIRTADSLIIVLWNDAADKDSPHLDSEPKLSGTPMITPQVDFAVIARAFGATGVSVTTMSDLDALKTWVHAGAQGTILLDCRISTSVVAEYQQATPHHLTPGL